MKKANYFQINSVVKVIKIIEHLVSKNEWSLAELTRKTGIAKTSVHRMLLTLQSLGYVTQNPENKCYAGSVRFFELGCKVIQHLDYIEIARPYLLELSKKTKETINLCVLDKLKMIVMDRVESKYTLKQDTKLGDSFKPYCSAAGKAVLAYLDKAQRQKLLTTLELKPETHNSIHTIEELKKELEITASNGYAVDNEEFLIGLRCVGAPVFNHNNEIIAGLSVSAPAARLTMRDVPELAQIVVSAARKISRRLGAT